MKVHSEQKLKRLVGLRETGHSINEIVAILGLPKSTVWHHVQKIKVLEKYTKILKAKQGSSQTRALVDWRQAKALAGKIIGKVSQRDKFIIAACLYWAEGSKKDFCLVNTDPNLIQIFLRCLKEFGVPQSALHYSIRIYEDIELESAKKFWGKTVGVSPNSITSVEVIKGRKHGKLQYGMLRLRVKKGKTFFKLINSLRESLVIAT